MKKRKILVITGGGDCPGLNAVIRGIVKASAGHNDIEIYGSIEGFTGVWLTDPPEYIRLDNNAVRGIHVKGGTIIKTTNKSNPLAFPQKDKNGKTVYADKTDELVQKLRSEGFDTLINIGGDGSQRISLRMQELGFNVVGVPKTIDNDLRGTDLTFGFRTAVQIATESFDKLVTTAESHSRVLIMEVMGRNAGWIALHTAIAGGAEICLIPEIPYNVDVLVKRIEKRYNKGRGFVNIVIAEGAKEIGKSVHGHKDENQAYENLRLGGVAYQLSQRLKSSGCEADIRETVLGHIQRGGTPMAYDRYLALLFGVKAFEMVKNNRFGKMVSFKGNQFTETDLKEAVKDLNSVDPNSFEVRAAKELGISFGDS